MFDLRSGTAKMLRMDLYHLLNRGVEKRTLFLDQQDYRRFVLGLEVFNDVRPIENIFRIVNGTSVPLTMSHKEKLVDIHGWCLMRNHYHLLVSERVEGGVTKFIRKLNIGYSKYFNQKYKRSGTLFQGRTKKILIETDAHFLHILNYIHLNPLDYHTDLRHWRNGKITDVKQAVAQLDAYKWSSFHNYSRESGAQNITTTELFEDVFKDYTGQLRKYLKTIELEEMQPYLLE